MSRPEPDEEMTEEEIQAELERERAEAKAEGKGLVEKYVAQMTVTEEDYGDPEIMEILKEGALLSAVVGLEAAGYVATSEPEVTYEPHMFGGEVLEYEDENGTTKTVTIVGYFYATIKGYKP